MNRRTPKRRYLAGCMNVNTAQVAKCIALVVTTIAAPSQWTQSRPVPRAASMSRATKNVTPTIRGHIGHDAAFAPVRDTMAHNRKPPIAKSTSATMTAGVRHGRSCHTRRATKKYAAANNSMTAPQTARDNKYAGNEYRLIPA